MKAHEPGLIQDIFEKTMGVAGAAGFKAAIQQGVGQALVTASQSPGEIKAASAGTRVGAEVAR